MTSSAEKEPLFTRFFLASLLTAFVGCIFSMLPLFLSAVKLDATQDTIATSSHYTVGVLFFDFRYTSLSATWKDLLFSSIALGIASSINWIETSLNSKGAEGDSSLGKLANGFAAASAFGLVWSIVLLVIILQFDGQGKVDRAAMAKYYQAVCILVPIVVLNYFGTILQIRRICDMRGK